MSTPFTIHLKMNAPEIFTDEDVATECIAVVQAAFDGHRIELESVAVGRTVEETSAPE
jgi:hypothetical protein